MGLKRLANKIAEYKERFEEGKVDKIKPDHVLKVLKSCRPRRPPWPKRFPLPRPTTRSSA